MGKKAAPESEPPATDETTKLLPPKAPSPVNANSHDDGERSVGRDKQQSYQPPAPVSASGSTAPTSELTAHNIEVMSAMSTPVMPNRRMSALSRQSFKRQSGMEEDDDWDMESLATEDGAPWVSEPPRAVVCVCATVLGLTVAPTGAACLCGETTDLCCGGCG